MAEDLRIYLAGPLFTHAERLWNRALFQQLSLLIPTARIILPQVEATKYIRESGLDFEGIVGSCIEQLDKANLILAILDGSDSDSGTSWECGYAYAKGKRVIGVRTDLRGSEDEGLNAMLRRTCEKIIYYSAMKEDIYDLAKQIASVILSHSED